MSRRSRSAAPTVNLFPFLAVLLCMMGALVFLLIALSDRVGVDPALIVTAPPAAAPAPSPEPIIIRPTLRLPEPVIHDADIIGTTLTQSDVDAPLLAEIERLEDELSVRLRRRAMAEDGEKEVAAQTAAARQQYEMLNAKFQAAATAQQQSQQQLASAGQSVERTLERLTQLNNQLGAKLTAPKAKRTAFRIMPYDRTTGTQRHPIVIECVADGFRFGMEDVLIERNEMRETTLQSNPLLDGVNEMFAYYSKRGEHPYVLLIVHPDGLNSFRIARGILQFHRRRWGYELVPAGMELNWPKAASSASTDLELAVRQVRRRHGTPLDPDNEDVFATLESEMNKSQQQDGYLARRSPAYSGGGSVDGNFASGGGNQAGGSRMRAADSSWSDGQTSNPYGPASAATTGEAYAGQQGLMPSNVSRSPGIQNETASDRSSAGSPLSGPSPSAPLTRRLDSSPQRLTLDDPVSAMNRSADGYTDRNADRTSNVDNGGFRSTQPRDPWERDRPTPANVRPMRRWGKQSPDQWIGYEKQVFITIAEDQLQWRDYTIAELSTRSPQQLSESLAELLDVVSIDWNPPNTRMHWRPVFVLAAPATALDTRMEQACKTIDVGFRRIPADEYQRLASEPTGEAVR